MHYEPDDHCADINPATGLPMVDDTDIDVCGNPYGTGMNTWQPTYDTGPSYMPLPSSFDPW